ncbi:MAG: RimJ/RimL family protein N-acetyltransferase [Paracoccaceae bacterium]|jgi:RimJ/RimL family protein N-acetyltransferase
MTDGHDAATDAQAPAGVLTLRAPHPTDAALIGHYLADPRVARHLTAIPHPYPPGAAEALVDRALAGKRTGPLYVMDVGGAVVGLIFVNAAGQGVARFGYMVAPAWWNTGYATAGVAAALKAQFASGIDAVTANVFTDNDASARVLTRLGFAYEGEGEEYSAGRGGVAPCWRYRLTRARFDAAKDS